MSRSCLVCSHLARQAIDALIDTGVSDYEVGRRFNIERVSVGQHRRKHIIKPAQDRLSILAKGTEAWRERQELASAAASDAPSTQALVEATLGLRRQMEKLTSIEQRLERMANLAEGTGSSAGVATPAAQQFRGIETGARLAGIGGFTPASHASTPQRTGPVFSITMVFPSVGRQETISLVENSRSAEIEREVGQHEIMDVGVSREATDDA